MLIAWIIGLGLIYTFCLFAFAIVIGLCLLSYGIFLHLKELFIENIKVFFR